MSRNKNNAKKMKHNPFLKYGTGIQNYFILQQRLMSLFCLLSVLALG